ncbi:deoxyribonuclease IV [Actinoalloteichus caeruleus]|uniref:Endonuclease IV n=1 Tax=Actinoalloteichus caeruleus DSM 43889 TaxID=1120930 RepID=A0ABT1JKH9_ACTCY|nr:deoxyribonuclease IV [Actinoalloteichus caeruleus]MCP2333020.1 Endonuclease IV (EC 3.1.21.-) [Actinoalloteichus caeruleus DSM 43889]
MLIGAHVGDDDPLNEAEARGAEVVQVFLADPKSWKAATPHPQAEPLRAAGVQLFVHSPYVINVASTNNRIRIPSRKLLLSHAEAAAASGAAGLVVHGGHARKGEPEDVGIENWRKLFGRQHAEGGFPVPVLVENTAGGDGALARRFDVLARLWDAIGEYEPGFCLDTCHAFAAGEDLGDVVDRVRSITGRIDLVHLNSSRDPFGSSRDRHANIGDGTIDPELLVSVCSAANAPVVVETPSEGQAEDIAFLRGRLGAG